MLEIERFDLDEIAFALSDQNLYDEHLHLINPETGEIILWTREGGIDGTNPIDLDDLDWCIDQIMPANPAYLMALPTKNDPMLSYLTTAFQDHVRVRQKFGYKVNDRMWKFFQALEVIDRNGRPGPSFGQPSRGATSRISVRPKLSIARAAFPIFWPSCGWTRTMTGFWSSVTTVCRPVGGSLLSRPVRRFRRIRRGR